jgi:predicted ATP-grasp superfamily ATP-dependent carboligase
MQESDAVTRTPWRRGRPGPLACVVGEIDVVRALGLAGIPCAVVSPPGDFTRYSRHRRVSLDRVDVWRRPGEMVERLVAFGRAQPERPVLYYDGDWDLLMVSRHREALGEAFRFVVPSAELVEDLVDKARFQALVEAQRLPVPPTQRFDPSMRPEDVALRFPLVVKPMTRLHATWKPLASTKVIQVDDAAALAALWPQLAAAGIDALLQEVVPGPESNIESYHAYVAGDGRIAAEFTGRKIRTYPVTHGYSTSLEISDAPDVLELGRSILGQLDFRGVAKADFKRHPVDGRLYLLEINPRFNLWHHLGAKAGVNIPEIVYRDLTGLPVAPAVPARPGVRWISLWRDVSAARAGGVPLHRWVPWALRSEAKCAVAWDDPFPLLGASLHRAVHRAKAPTATPGH